MNPSTKKLADVVFKLALALVLVGSAVVYEARFAVVTGSIGILLAMWAMFEALSVSRGAWEDNA